MGTNYYLQEIVDCDLGHEHVRRTHIGKSSAGWKFTFHATEDCTCYEDWHHSIRNAVDNMDLIHDEYGRVVKPEELLTIIDHKQTGQHRIETAQEYLDGDGYYFVMNEFS